MKKIGTLHAVVGKTVVIRISSEEIPSIGEALYDREGRKVGVVLDIIGPVSSPFAVLRGEVRKEYFRRGGRHDGKKGMPRMWLHKNKV